MIVTDQRRGHVSLHETLISKMFRLKLLELFCLGRCWNCFQQLQVHQVIDVTWIVLVKKRFAFHANDLTSNCSDLYQLRRDSWRVSCKFQFCQLNERLFGKIICSVRILLAWRADKSEPAGGRIWQDLMALPREGVRSFANAYVPNMKSGKPCAARGLGTPDDSPALHRPRCIGGCTDAYVCVRVCPPFQLPGADTPEPFAGRRPCVHIVNRALSLFAPVPWRFTGSAFTTAVNKTPIIIKYYLRACTRRIISIKNERLRFHFDFRRLPAGYGNNCAMVSRPCGKIFVRNGRWMRIREFVCRLLKLIDFAKIYWLHRRPLVLTVRLKNERTKGFTGMNETTWM